MSEEQEDREHPDVRQRKRAADSGVGNRRDVALSGESDNPLVQLRRYGDDSVGVAKGVADQEARARAALLFVKLGKAPGMHMHYIGDA